MLITQVMEESNSSAWQTHDHYEEDLVHLGWTLAHEGGRVPSKETHASTMSTINQTLEQQNHQLKTQLEALRHINTTTNAWCKELSEVLNDEHLNTLIQSNEAFLLDEQCKNLKARCISLQSQLQDGNLPPAPHNSPMFGSEDIEMMSKLPWPRVMDRIGQPGPEKMVISDEENLPQTGPMSWDIKPYSVGQLSRDGLGLNLPQTGPMSWDIDSFSMGQLSQDGLSLCHPEDDSDFMRLKTLSDQAIAHIAAACDELNIKHE